MAQTLLLDTDLLIDFLRGNRQAVAFLEGETAPMAVSALTIAELHAGVRDGEERTQLDELLSIFGQIPLDPETAGEGGLFRRDFGPSHGTGLIDAMLAATALRYGLRLVTLNDKHYPMLKNVVVPYRKR
jgi:predicted nucleic acid-binding protein